MKRSRWLVLVGVVGLLLLMLAFWWHWDYQRECYGGRHTREWAWQLLTATTPEDREAATNALRALGPQAVRPLRAMLRERDKAYEKPLVQASRILPAEERQTFLRHLRPGQALANRVAAIQAVAVLGVTASNAVPELAAGLQETHGQLRWESARALGQLGAAGVTALLRAAGDTNSGVRQAALFVLADAPPDFPGLAAGVIQGLFDADEPVRGTASYAVEKLRVDALPEVVRRLNRADPREQLTALQALARLRPAFRSVEAPVLNLATNGPPEIRRQAMVTMGALRFTSTNALILMRAALEDPALELRTSAIFAVSQVSWKTPDLVPHLISLTATGSLAERLAAVNALGQYRAQASNSLPALIGIWQDPIPELRLAATNAAQRLSQP
jgi:HEAT repeat protein